MKLASFEAIVQALNSAEVRFIVVGGLAVIAHGYGRVTRDIDLVIQLQPEAIINAFRALEALGYLPRAPISATQFADPGLRSQWIREKGMKVLNFHSDAHRETPVGLFITEHSTSRTSMPLPYCRNPHLASRLEFLRLDSLLRMKAEAGRGQDLADIDELNLLYGRKSSYDA